MSARDRAEQAEREKQKARLIELEKIQKPMQTVVLDGDTRTAYFVGKHQLEISETVISVPFSKLLILVGQMLQAIIAPAFSGIVPTQREGGGDPKSPLNIS